MSTPYRPQPGQTGTQFAAPAKKSKKPIFITLGALLLVVILALAFSSKSKQAKKDYFAIYTKLSDFGRKTPDNSSERITLSDDEIKGAIEQLSKDPKAGDPEGGWTAVVKALSMCSNNQLLPICFEQLPKNKLGEDPHNRLMYQLAQNQAPQFATHHKQFVDYLKKVDSRTRGYVMQYCYKLFGDDDADLVLAQIVNKDGSAAQAEELYRRMIVNSKDRSGLARKAMDLYEMKGNQDEYVRSSLMRAAAPGANASMMEQLKAMLASGDNNKHIAAFKVLSYWGKDREAFDLLLKEYDKLGSDFMAQRNPYMAMTDLLMRNYPFRKDDETFACFEQVYQRANAHERADINKSRLIQLSNALPGQWDYPWVRKAIVLIKTSSEREVVRNADKASANIKTRGVYKGY